MNVRGVSPFLFVTWLKEMAIRGRWLSISYQRRDLPLYPLHKEEDGDKIGTSKVYIKYIKNHWKDICGGKLSKRYLNQDIKVIDDL